MNKSKSLTDKFKYGSWYCNICGVEHPKRKPGIYKLAELKAAKIKKMEKAKEK